MKNLLIALLLLALSVPFLHAALNLPKDETRREGEWTMITVVLKQGTRSQIILGKLKFKESEIIGEPGHLLETPFGRFVWRNSYDQGYLRGWITVDSDLDIKELIPSELPSKTLGGLPALSRNDHRNYNPFLLSKAFPR